MAGASVESLRSAPRRPPRPDSASPGRRRGEGCRVAGQGRARGRGSSTSARDARARPCPRPRLHVLGANSRQPRAARARGPAPEPSPRAGRRGECELRGRHAPPGKTSEPPSRVQRRAACPQWSPKRSLPRSTHRRVPRPSPRPRPSPTGSQEELQAARGRCVQTQSCGQSRLPRSPWHEV